MIALIVVITITGYCITDINYYNLDKNLVTFLFEPTTVKRCLQRKCKSDFW